MPPLSPPDLAPLAGASTTPDRLPSWRRLPVGAELAPEGRGVHFRVWAPERQRVEALVVAPDGREHAVALSRADDGYWSGMTTEAGVGARYRYRLDGGDAFPDPASRFLPDGPHGDSEVIDPAAFAWTDAAWRGVPIDRQVIYELHVGTFTPEGTWDAAARELPALAELGVTTLEVMPIAEFAGDFGWGYDGVSLFAPTRLYGRPDELRRFVDRAHALGLAVILDVVYNHLGPDGNYLPQFSPYYVSDTLKNDWGEGLNFDGPNASGVRELFIANASYWIDEFHLDGLRLDATQAIHDTSTPHVLQEIGAAVRAAAPGRTTFIVNENEPQHTRLVHPVSDGGCGLDAIWNDDWHHAAMVALTGRDEAYYTDYRGSPQELVSAAKYGFLYQGQYYRWQRARRGTPTRGTEPWRFVHFLQNHDQIANSGRGERLHRLANPSRLRAATALLLLGPQTPMLFMGQELAADAPFLFFADHEPELARLVADGRGTELSQFANLDLDEMTATLAAPADRATFERCKLHRDGADPDGRWRRLHTDLIALRRSDPCFGVPDTPFDGAVLSDAAFVLRWFAPNGADRLLAVNLGTSLHLDPAPEPLLAPPLGARWTIAWSSEDPRYGGLGMPSVDAAESPRSPRRKPALRWPRENWRLTGGSAVVLVPEPA